MQMRLKKKNVSVTQQIIGYLRRREGRVGPIRRKKIDVSFSIETHEAPREGEEEFNARMREDDGSDGDADDEIAINQDKEKSLPLSKENAHKKKKTW